MIENSIKCPKNYLNEKLLILLQEYCIYNKKLDMALGH